ncbi:hypothetical protein OEZ86_007218 [Tetradesmus obliquus]|nr:hypothetical protein OEZ86_007218 [Tetradesmus obliquus]
MASLSTAKNRVEHVAFSKLAAGLRRPWPRAVAAAVSVLVAAVVLGLASHLYLEWKARQISHLPDAPAMCPLEMRKNTRWGVATASYQVEGGWNLGGRTPSVWDTFSHAGFIKNNDTGDVACDMYHKYPQDFKLMRELGIKHYRFSFSWNRILPQGGKGTPVNPEGIAFYNSLINEMIANNIRPYATIFHWDLPQVLQDKYQGLIGEEFIADFVNYANVLFENFGDRIRDWMTFNEPWVTCVLQYGQGVFAPGIPMGDEGMYKCGHNLLRAHAKTYELYHKVPQAKLENATFADAARGKVGIALNIEYLEPLTEAKEDVAAANYGLEKNLGWFADPLFFGDYPASLKSCAKDVLPSFTAEESKLLKGSLDFLGINFYTGKFAKGSTTDKCSVETREQDVNGKDIGPLAESSWLRVVPWSFYKLLKYVQSRYDPKQIMITENGVSAPKEDSMSVQQAIRDDFRVNYYKGYLDYLCKAISEGVKVSTYFAWSFMDNFEWREGYSQRFGINHVDFDSPELTRTTKDSGKFLSKHFFRVGRGGGVGARRPGGRKPTKETPAAAKPKEAPGAAKPAKQQ